MIRTVENLEVLLQQEKEKNTQLEAISKGSGDSAETLKKQLAVLELRYQALCSAYRRRISELPRELFVLEQERKKIETEHQNKLIVINQKLADAKSQEEAILNEMDKTGQGKSPRIFIRSHIEIIFSIRRNARTKLSPYSRCP